MNNKEVSRKKKKIAAVDVLIVILLVLCVAGIGLRIAVGENGLFYADTKDEYLVSYVIYSESDEYSALFAEGCEFFFESGERLGTVTGTPSLTPSKIVNKTSSGNYTVSYANDGTVDIKGTVLVRGTMTDSGLLVSSSTYIAPNMTVSVASSDISADMHITDIKAAQ